MTSVAVGGPGLIAGGVVIGPDDVDALVWTSPDGRSWTPVPDATGAFRNPGGVPSDEVIHDVAARNDLVVAVGTGGSPGSRTAAVWTSGDGLTWDRVLVADALDGDGGQAMNAVALTGDSVVAVGESVDRAAAWYSHDGMEWTQAQITDTPGHSPAESTMTDVTTGGPGLVAVGSVGHEASPAVWLSGDGAIWTRVPDLPLTEWLLEPEWVGSRPTAVSVTDSAYGLIMVGSTHAGPFVWRSIDGFDWKDVGSRLVDEPTAARPAGPYDYLKRIAPISIVEVVAHGDLLVALGGYEPAPTAGKIPQFVTVWHSTDGGFTWSVGSEWTLEPSDSQRWRGGTDVANFGEELVLVGIDELPTQENRFGYMEYAASAAAWWAKLER